MGEEAEYMDYPIRARAAVSTDMGLGADWLGGGESERLARRPSAAQITCRCLSVSAAQSDALRCAAVHDVRTPALSLISIRRCSAEWFDHSSGTSTSGAINQLRHSINARGITANGTVGAHSFELEGRVKLTRVGGR